MASVALRAREHVDKVLVVDDGSIDATAHVARLAGAEVLVHGTNRGKGAALRTGILAAIERGADVIVLLDGDGQHDPGAIPDLCAPIEKGDADVVVGSRHLVAQGTTPAHRRAGQRVLDGATNALGGLAATDTQSGFRALRAKAAEQLLPREAGMGVESEMLLAAAWRGFRVAEVPIAALYPPDVRPHVHPVRHGASVLAALLRLVREEHPRAFFGGAGLLLLGGGLLTGWETASHYYATGEFWPGKAMVSMLLLLLGSQAVLAAILLDFLNLKLGRR